LRQFLSSVATSEVHRLESIQNRLREKKTRRFEHYLDPLLSGRVRHLFQMLEHSEVTLSRDFTPSPLHGCQRVLENLWLANAI
jgi:hypothetical protein